ncbi:MAG TPA: multiheme c-type cytochrome [Stellaceae bacterium]|nr:multiheme c-type cytochrome [Stellaceae bacterium]
MIGFLRWQVIACALFFALTASARADDVVHLGVQSCAGNNCHGAVHPIGNSQVPQNEYFIWSEKDKHAHAYSVLSNDRSKRIAKNLGLADAEHAPLCLDCHADNVPPAQRGPQFQLSDGVGCEACHGGAEKWLGPHLSGESHAANIKAGLYPTDQPEARAVRCLSCHVGGEKKFVTHTIMGAGHPPMPFELDTYTAIEPAHFVVNKSYIERKGRPNDMQIWAMGLANDVKLRMDLVLSPAHAAKGVNFELSLFDCQSCHHSMSELQWRARSTTDLPPGRIKLYDATTVMLLVAADRVSPDAAKALATHLLALHAATGDSWDAVKREATTVREIADKLIPQIASHDFTKDDAAKLSHAVVASALNTGGDLDYSGAQQQVMALESIVAAMKHLGFADEKQLAPLEATMNGLYEAVANDQTYKPDTYVAAMKAFSSKLPI